MGLYGAGVNVLTAPHPLGPWTNVTATLDPGCAMWKQSTCFEKGPGQSCNLIVTLTLTLTRTRTLTLTEPEPEP